MAARFYFSYDRDFTGSFSSAEGEEYTVKTNPRGRYYDDEGYNQGYYDAPQVTISWKEVSSKLITLSGQYPNSNETFANKNFFVKDKTSIVIPYFAQNCNIKTGYTILIVVATFSPLLKGEQPVDKPAVQKLTPTKLEPKVEKKLEQLATDMRNLLQSGNLSDVVLTDGSKEIHAHKLILSTRSSVFAKMFQHPMKENRENRITIKDITHEVLLQLLNFMYAGTVIIKDSNMARELYVAADKYDVKDLRGICSTMLKSIDLNSVLDTLLLADLYSDKVLKEAALTFISKNYSQVKILQKWNSFMKEHQGLAIEILSFIVDKK